MKKLLLLLFLAQASVSYCQEKERLLETEKTYKDVQTISKKEARINGRVNRKVKPEETNTYLIEYDFRTGFYTRNLLDLKVNTPVVFRVINVNRLAYDVKVIPRDSTLADTGWEDGVMEFLKANSLPTTTEAKQEENKAALSSNTKTTILNRDDIKISAIEKKDSLVKNLNNISHNLNLGIEELKNKINLNEQEIDKIETSKASRKAELDDINQKIILDPINTNLKKDKDEIVLDIKSKDAQITERKKIKDDDSKKLRANEGQLKSIQDNYLQLELQYKAFITTYTDLKTIYFKILKVNECYNQARGYTSDPLLSSEQIILEEGKSIEQLKLLFPSIQDDYQDFLGKYIQLGHEFYALNQNEKFSQLDSGGQSKFIEPAQNMKTLADNWNEEFKKADVNALIHEMKRAFELLKKPDVYVYTSQPFQPVKDVLIFDIKIKKYNQDKPDFNNNRQFPHKEYTRGGMRFDAGVGFAISYFDDAAQYEIAPNDKGVDVITLKQKNLWVPSFVGIFTAGFRSNNLASFGISAGLGLSADEGKLQINNFYFGPSITIGRENRLCITGGITVKGVEELKSGLIEGTTVTNTNEISSFTNTAYKFGPFVSLTYNLTKGIRNNVKYFYKK